MDPIELMKQLAGGYSFGVPPIQAANTLESMKTRNQQMDRKYYQSADQYGYTDPRTNEMLTKRVGQGLELDQAMGRLIGQEPSGYPDDNLNIAKELIRRLAGQHFPVDFTGDPNYKPSGHIRQMTPTSPVHYYK